MPERTSPKERIRLQNVAEREIHRFDDHATWHKHVHNVELDPMQVLKMEAMDREPNTVDYSCRRTGKTAVKELWFLEHGARNADQELGIVAPRQGQSQVNLGYHLDGIRRSEILSAYIAHKNGRRQMADTYYQFANRSRAEAYGIMANVDGGDLTAASLEEVDDMPRDRLFSRFLLMMGATRKLGASASSRNNPIVRVTGVFKGADTLAELIANGHYHQLPVMDVHLGIRMGILDESFMAFMRDQLSTEEYIRQLLCRNVSSRNLIWEKFLRQAIQVGIRANVGLQEPVPGEVYRKRGFIGIGYDASGHGEQPESSKHAAVVVETLGEWIYFPYARTWPPGTDESVVKRDLKAIMHYFRPDQGIGDAYGVGMLSQLNDELFAEGLTHIDRHAVGDGQSTASNWPEWYFAPLRFEGMVKHQMARALKMLFHNGKAVMPYVDDLDPGQSDAGDDMRLLQRQLTNIRGRGTSKSYDAYEMVDKKRGDDLFDAAMAAVWTIVNRLYQGAPTAILVGGRSREQMLEGYHA